MFTMVRIQGMANERRHETLRNKLQAWFKSERVFLDINFMTSYYIGRF